MLEVSEASALEARDLLVVERWALHIAKIVLPKSGPIEFSEHPFLREIYRDLNPEIVLMKGAQLGLSTAAIVRAFWMLTTWPCTVIYTMPTPADVWQHTQSRINPIITRSEYLRSRIVRVDSVAQKQFAVAPGMTGFYSKRDDLPRSIIHFRGSASDRDAVSVDADLLIHDEEDISNPSVIDQFESRLDASRFKWKFRLSTPRLPNAGIDRVFQRTDKRHWFIKCPACNTRFEMAFPGGPWEYGNIWPDPTEWEVADWSRWEAAGMPAKYVCHKCGAEIKDRSDGEWVAEHPDRTAHGYSVSQMAAPWVSADRVLYRRMKAGWEQHFWNLVMGLPFQSESMGFTRAQLIGGPDDDGLTDPHRKRLAGPESGNRDYRMGIDPGMVHDWVMDENTVNGWRTVAMGTAANFDELNAITKRWMPRRVIVDGAFDPTAVREYQSDWNTARHKRVWLAFYSRALKNPLVWDPERAFVTMDRTVHLSRYADQRALSPGSLPKFDGDNIYERFITHHINSKKVPIWVKGLESQRVLDHYEWIEVGPDHQFHASSYAMLAREVPGVMGAPLVRMQSVNRPKWIPEASPIPPRPKPFEEFEK